MIPKPRPSSFIAAALAVAVAACSGDGPAAPERTTAALDIRQAPLTRATRQFEIDYMTFSIDHHTLGVSVAYGCTRKAVLDDLRALCERNVRDQLREIEQLQTWLRQWYGIRNFQATFTEADLAMLRELGALRGEAFDRRFMQMFSMHHATIVSRSRPVLHQAYHRPLQERIAAPIVQNQSRDIAEMQSWLCIYYDVCGGVPPQTS